MSTLALYVDDQGRLVKVIDGKEYPLPFEYSNEAADLILTRQGKITKVLAHDSRTLPVFSKSLFRDLRRKGLSIEDIMMVSGELLQLVAEEIKERRKG